LKDVTHPPTFSFPGGELAEVRKLSGFANPNEKQWVVRPKDANGKTIQGEEMFFPTRAEAEDYVLSGIYHKANRFKRQDQWVVVDKDGNWKQSFPTREQASDKILDDLGVEHVPSSYLTIKQADDFYRFTRMGQRITQFFTDTDSPGLIYFLTQGKIDWETARRLAAGRTTDDTLSILGPRTGSVISNPRGLTRAGASALRDGKVPISSKIIEGYWVAQSKSPLFREVSRLAHMSPRQQSLNLNDTEEAIQQIIDVAVGLGHPALSKDGKGIIDYLDDFAKVQDSMGGRYSFFNNEGDGFFDAVVGGAMVRAGVPEDVVYRLSRSRRKPKKSKRKAYKGQTMPAERVQTPGEAENLFAQDYDLNRIMDGRMATGQWIAANNKDIPIYLDEAMRAYIPMPDYRAVRRQINYLGRAFRALDEKGVQKVLSAMKRGKKSTAEPFMTVYDALGESARWLTTHWRNFTLMSTPYFIRNVAEEQFRMGLAGNASVFTNPAQAISTAVMIAAGRSYASKASRAISNIAMLGMPLLIKKIRHDRVDATSIHMVKTDVLLDPNVNIRVPKKNATATVRGRKASQDALARNVARSGLEEPLTVAYDPAAQRWMLLDGHKRLHVYRTMPDGLRPSHLPVRIVEQKIPYARKGKKRQTRKYTKWSNKVPVEATTKMVPTPHRPKPLLEVDDTYNKAVPAHVFGKGSSAGTLDKLLSRAGDEMEELGGLSAAMTYAIPLFQRRYATIVGDDWNKGYNAALEGGWDEVSDLMTMAASNAAGGHHLVDEASQQMRGSGVEAFARDAKDIEDYLFNLALRHKQLSDLPHVKNMFAQYPLEPDMNVYVERLIQRKPEMMQQLRSIMVANEAPQSLRDVLKRIDGDLSPQDIEMLRNVLGAQLESAWLWGGKGASSEVSEAIHTGIYKGRKIGPDNEEYMNLLRSVMSQDSKRQMFPVEISGPTRRDAKGQTGSGYYNRFTEWFFNTAGENRDIMTASPLMRQEYTKAIIQLVPHMLPSARRKVVKNLLRAGDAGLAKKVERANQLKGGDAGFLTVEFAHQIASRRATTHLSKTFYNAMRRRNWAVAMRTVMPFAQAQINTLAKWGELMLKNPAPSYRTLRSIDALRSNVEITVEDLVAERWGGYQDTEPVPVEPFLVSDAQGQARYLMPGIGHLAKLVGVQAGASGTIESANLAAGGVVPGAGPVASLGASLFLEKMMDDPTWQGDVFRAMWRYPLPEGSLIDKMIGTVLPGKWADALATALEPRNPEFVKKQAQIFQQIMNEKDFRGVDLSNPTVAQAAIDEAVDEAAHKAQRLLWLESFTKLFLPAAGALTFEASQAIPNDDTGTLEFVANREAALLWQRYTGGATGAQYGEQVRRFQEDYGKFANYPFVSITDNRGAPPLTIEMQQIAYEMPETYQTWSGLWSYVMPKGDPMRNVFNTPGLAKFRESQERKGYRKTITFQEVVELQQNYYNQAILMSRLDKLNRQRPWDKAAAQRVRDEISAMGYRQFLTVDDSRGTLNEIRAMMKDEDAREVVPASQQIITYLKARDREVAELQAQTQYGKDTSSGDLSSKAGFYAAVRLDNLATKLARQDDTGSFLRFYETLARVEMGENADLVEEWQ
jgi:hypothetical protein